MPLETLWSSIIGAITAYIGSVETRMYKMQKQVAKLPTQAELQTFINLKNEATKVILTELKEDLKNLEKKIDKLIADRQNSR